MCDTPAELLASRATAAACFDVAWQTVGGKGADLKSTAAFLIRLQANSIFLEFATGCYFIKNL